MYRCRCAPLVRFLSLCLILSAISMAGWTPAAGAQAVPDSALRPLADTTVVQEVELEGGSKLIGRIIGVSQGVVTFRTLEGLEVHFPISQVRRIGQPHGVRHGRDFWPRDRSDSRLFIGPTARVSGHGHGYVGLYELFFPSAAIGFGDIAMVSGGMSIFPTLGLDEQIYYFAPKVRLLALDLVSAAAGLLYVGVGSEDEYGGLAYGVVTLGDDRAAVTAGPGFPFYSEGGFADETLAVVGGEVRVSRGLKLISENWFVPGSEGAFFTLGLRGLTGKNSIEFAVLIPTTDGVVIPVASFSAGW